jgi:hypothetical protein
MKEELERSTKQAGNPPQPLDLTGVPADFAERAREYEAQLASHTGAVIVHAEHWPGSEVTLTGAEGSFTAFVESSGLVRFLSVKPGLYMLKLIQDGFSKLSGIKVAVAPEDTTVVRVPKSVS